ncbi:TPA: diguanylate cyclase [Clostridioides difficile]|nr:diguanylate cyclase [Clostridioides difficile]HDJ1470933.1 diguanylate cyclase [Clostridioides difficile]
MIIDNLIDKLTNLNEEYNFKMKLSRLGKQHTTCGIILIRIYPLEQLDNSVANSLKGTNLDQIFNIISSYLPNGTSLYKLSGNRLGILYPHREYYELIELVRKLQKIIQGTQWIDKDGTSLTILGVVYLYPIDGINCGMIYKNIDTMLKRLNIEGKGRLTFYSDNILYSTVFLKYMRKCIANNFKGFYLNYEPLIFAKDKSLYGCEVSLCCINPKFEKEFKSIEFTSSVNYDYFINSINQWIIKTALAQLKIWTNHIPDFKMNINIQCKQLENPNFKLFVLDVIKEKNVSPTLITLELIECNLVRDIKEVNSSLNLLQRQGIQIAFDSLGTRFLPLETLHKLGANSVKIDRVLLKNITYDIINQKTLSGIISLCHNINLLIYIEGIDDRETLEIIEQMDPDILQGSYYGKPVDANKFYEYYLKNNIILLNNHDIKLNSTMSRSIHFKERQDIIYPNPSLTPSLDLNVLVDNIYAGILHVYMDTEFTLLTCNDGYRKILGYTIKDIEKEFKNKILGFIHPDDVEYVDYEIRKQLEFNDTILLEFRMIRSDGSSIWVTSTGNLMRDKQGLRSLLFVIIRNDNLKRASLEMEETYWKYKRVLDNIPSYIKCVHFDEYLTLDYISPNLVSLIGYTQKEITDRFDDKYINLILEEDRCTVFSDILNQINLKSPITLNYRIKCKNKQLISLSTLSKLHIDSSNGVQYIYSSIIDVVNLDVKKEMDKVDTLINHYQATLKHYDDVIFEYNFKDNGIIFSNNYYDIFQMEPNTTLTTLLTNICKDDHKLLLDALKVAALGDKPDKIELRFHLKNNIPLWCSITFNEPYKIGDLIVSLLGKIRNIDDEKRKYDKLIEQSQSDLMTGLLNKYTTEKRIRDTLFHNADKKYVLFMIDMDNFKFINDTMGHAFGDKVLSDLANCLKSNFNNSDVIGRVGGDEFLVFMEYGGDEKSIQNKCINILKELNNSFTNYNIPFEIGISIGISIYPKDANEFYELYNYADKALYRAKKSGKGTYCIFSKLDKRL